MEVSTDFKNKIKSLGRQFDVRVSYTTMYKLITEDDKLLITQDSLKLITEQTSTEYDAYFNGEEIKKLTKNNLGELFKTYMKSFDLEATHELYVGQNVNVELGVKEEQDSDFDYINYGTYYIYEKTYNEDTKTFTYMLCDKMMFTMVPYDNDAIFRSATELTCEELITRIIEYTDIIRVDVDNIVNGNCIVYKETLEGVEMTCRDVLDMIMQSQGCSLVIENDENGEIAVAKTIGNVVETIDEDVLSNTNLSFTKKFGKINSLLFSRASGTDNIERKDTEDISVNGYCQYVIENNLIIDQDNRVSYIDNLFDAIKNIEYYICDFDCTGLGYIDYLDRYNVTARGNTYSCLCLENTFTIENGMKESFKSEEPTQVKKSYTQGAKDDKNASITMNKLKGQIVLKTYEEDGKTKIAQVRLDSSGESGSLVEISGDQIDLTGKNINLTGDDITISSTKFNVDKNGKMTCTDANITGGKVSIEPNDAYSNVIEAKYGSYSTSLTPRYLTQSNNDCSIRAGYVSYIASGQEGYGLSAYLNGSSPSQGTYITAEVLPWANHSRLRVVKNNTGYQLDCVDGLITVSDKRLKENIKDIDKQTSMNVITSLNPIEFNYINGEKTHRGLIAQDVIEVLDNNDIKNQIYSLDITSDIYSLNYEELIPDLINCVKYQQEQIEELKKEIENFKGGSK